MFLQLNPLTFLKSESSYISTTRLKFMNSSIVERRLAAIIAMDVVGYSRLMGIDEVGTVTALKSHREELINIAVKASGGRVVKTTGDGLLLEFASIVDAIGCAVTIQRGMLSRNTNIPEAEQIVFRIGVNIGDIIIDGDDILGDGVNVAARLEALCEPGGVYISRAANEQVRDKLRLSFADLGEHTVKNIARAIGVFGLAARDIASLPEPGINQSQSDPPKVAETASAEPEQARVRLSGSVLAAGLAAAAVVVAAGGWWVVRDRSVLAGAPSPASVESRLIVALEKHRPDLSAKDRINQVSTYTASQWHRAFAAPRNAAGVWYTSIWPAREIAEEKVLEKCVQFFNEPCALMAADDTVAAPGVDGMWPIRDAPRVRYAGAFNPERIPALRQEALLRPSQRTESHSHPSLGTNLRLNV